MLVAVISPKDFNPGLKLKHFMPRNWYIKNLNKNSKY